jgi:beta-galactosidase GanA
MDIERILVPRSVELGCQIYVNKYDPPEKVRKWVHKIHEAGLSIMRVFIFWDIINPRRDEWYFDPFDALFEEGEKLDIKVCATLWAVNPPGWMGITQSFCELGDLDDSEYWATALKMVEKVVGRYHNSPILDSWIGWKEATRSIGKHENSMRAFRQFLKETYGNTETFNRIYYNQLECFEDYGRRPSGGQFEVPPYADTLDWYRFAVWNLRGKLTELTETIRRIDKVHPVHVNGHWLATNQLWGGQSLWQEAHAVDFTGLSNHLFYGGERFTPDRYHQANALCDDIARSATRAGNGMFWLTEGTGGPAVMSNTSTYWSMTGEDMDLLVWEDLGSGASKCLYWQIGTRNSGYEAGEQSLCGLDETPTPRLKALTKAADLIRKNQRLFDETIAKKPDIWLLHSETAWELGEFEGTHFGFGVSKGFGNDKHNPRNRDYGPDALAGAYEMAADLGLQIGLVDEERVINGEIPQDAIIVAPTAFSVENGLIASFDRFVKNGGTLIADHLFGFRDKYGRIPEPGDAKLVLDRLFGATLHDVFSTHDEIMFETPGRQSATGWMFKLLFQKDHISPDCEVLAYWTDDGSPAVLRNTYGKGQSVRIGTCFFQRYFAEPDPGSLAYFRSLLPDSVFGGLRLMNPSTQLRLRELTGGGKSIAILLNHNRHAVQAFLKTDQDGHLTPLDGGETIELSRSAPAIIVLDKTQARQFVFEPSV